MKDNLMSYRVKLIVVGPVHIGSGTKLEKLDYIINGGKIYVIDPSKLFYGLNKLKLLTKFERDVLSFGELNLSAFVRQNDIRQEEYKGWAAYSYSINRDMNVKNMQIMTCVKDSYNLPYVPGSSLKGAIRGAILNAELAKGGYRALATSVERGSNENAKRNYYLANEARQAEQIFYTYNVEKDKRPTMSNDIFKGFIVSDSKPLKREDIVLCQKLDIAPHSKSHKLNLLRECIRPGTVIEFSVTVNPKVFKYGIAEVTEAISTFYKRQKACFLSRFDSVQSDCLKDNLMYLGGGSGFVSKTVTYSLFDDDEKALNVTAKILDSVDSKMRGKKVGNHLKDPSRYGVSPHIRKCTMYNNAVYDFGLCKIDFQPIG